MKLFYRFMVWATSFELSIARSTGRNPNNVAQLSTDLSKWEGELWKREMGFM